LNSFESSFGDHVIVVKVHLLIHYNASNSFSSPHLAAAKCVVLIVFHELHI
jgi:hypothetical protein